jgi:hypothetical protein
MWLSIFNYNVSGHGINIGWGFDPPSSQVEEWNDAVADLYLIGLWWIDRLAVAVTVSDGDGDGMAVLFEEAMYTLWISELRGLHNVNVAGCMCFYQYWIWPNFIGG